MPKAGDNKKCDTVADPIRQSNRVAAKAKAATVTPGKTGAAPVANNSELSAELMANLKDQQRSVDERYVQLRTDRKREQDKVMKTLVAQIEQRLEQNDQKVAELENNVKAAVLRQDAM